MPDTGRFEPDRKYDRDYLLSEPKRNQVVELWEVVIRTTFISTA
jgi:hypothetical protein